MHLSETLIDSILLRRSPDQIERSWRAGPIEATLVAPSRIKVPFAPKIPVDEVPLRALAARPTLHYEESARPECLQLFNEVASSHRPFLPNVFATAYEFLGRTTPDAGQRTNRFIRAHAWVFGFFPYPSDQFLLAYKPGAEVLWLAGRPASLERVLLDVLSFAGPVIPVHAACLAGRWRAGLVLGRSGSGKTSLVLQAALRGASVLGDELTYLGTDAAYRLSDYVAVRTPWCPLPLRGFAEDGQAGSTLLDVTKCAEAGAMTVLDRAVPSGTIVLSPLNLSPLDPLDVFVVFHRDSMWALDWLERPELLVERVDQSLERIRTAVTEWPVRTVRVDFNRFAEYVTSLVDWLDQ